MRIAYICADPGVPVFGRKGSSVHVQEVIRAMLRTGASVTLFANRFDGDCPADLAAVRVCQLPRPPKGDPAAREKEALAANDALERALVTSGPFDLVYERYSLWSFAGMHFARSAGIPGVLEVNAPLIEEQAEHRDLVDRLAAEQVAQRAFGAATVLTAVSKQVAEYLHTFPVTAGRVEVIANGVNPLRFPEGLPPLIPAAAGTFTIGFVGTLKRWHGLPVLIDAFDRLHNNDSQTRLLIVGDGGERESIESDLQRRGLLHAVTMTGAVPPETIAGYLASVDVGVAPYPDLPDFYFSPLKVLEYMAAGLPVVASDIGQISEIITPGVNGVLCPPGSPSALTWALSQLRHDPLERERLGTAARASVLRDHTWDGVMQHMYTLAGFGSLVQPQPVGTGS